MGLERVEWVPLLRSHRRVWQKSVKGRICDHVDYADSSSLSNSNTPHVLPLILFITCFAFNLSTCFIHFTPFLSKSKTCFSFQLNFLFLIFLRLKWYKINDNVSKGTNVMFISRIISFWNIIWKYYFWMLLKNILINY